MNPREEKALCRYLEGRLNRQVAPLLARIVDDAMVQHPTADARDLIATVSGAVVAIDSEGLRKSISAACVSVEARTGHVARLWWSK